MIATVMLLGSAVEMLAWWAVATKRVSVWLTMSLALPAMGIAAVMARTPPLSPAVSPELAALAGAGAGAALYLATRAFVAVVRGWRAFQRQSMEMYGRASELPFALILLLALGLMVTGEELFWRGLFQARMTDAFDGRTSGAVVTWLAFVAANLPSRNLAIVAGAVVGGAAWTVLAWWTGGVLASLLCHGVWTALMLSFPVVPVAAKGST